MVHGVPELLRDFKGCNENPGFEIRVACRSLDDFAEDGALVELRFRTVAAGFEYKSSSAGGRGAPISPSLIAGTGMPEWSTE